MLINPVKLFSFLVMIFFVLYTYFLSQDNQSVLIWLIPFIASSFLFSYLLRFNKNNPPMLIFLIFIGTYYIAPLPYLVYEIPIVPYIPNISIYSFTLTFTIMSTYLCVLCFYSDNIKKLNISNNKYLAFKNLDVNFNKPFIFLYWLMSIIFALATFRGDTIVNSEGVDKYEAYMSNLDNQSGALEYFYILYVIGVSLSNKKYNRLIAFLVAAVYLYFTFTRGYRVQMLEMILLVTYFFLIRYLTFNRVVILAILGFLLLQIHGSMKHGVGDWYSAASIFFGGEVRTNQTEVFYTSNNVINAIFSGDIFFHNRIISLLTALLACIVPTVLLPNYWHPSLYVNELTGLPGGGGGFIVSHLFFWSSYFGIILFGYLTIKIFSELKSPSSNLSYYLSILLFATFPRWVAYEPIGSLFRTAIYFCIMWYVVYRLIPSVHRYFRVL